MKHKKHSTHKATHHTAKRSALSRPVPMLAVVSTLILVVLGLGVWLQSVVASGGM